MLRARGHKCELCRGALPEHLALRLFGALLSCGQCTREWGPRGPQGGQVPWALSQSPEAASHVFRVQRPGEDAPRECASGEPVATELLALLSGRQRPCALTRFLSLAARWGSHWGTAFWGRATKQLRRHSRTSFRRWQEEGSPTVPWRNDETALVDDAILRRQLGKRRTALGTPDSRRNWLRARREARDLYTVFCDAHGNGIRYWRTTQTAAVEAAEAMGARWQSRQRAASAAASSSLPVEALQVVLERTHVDMRSACAIELTTSRLRFSPERGGVWAALCYARFGKARVTQTRRRFQYREPQRQTPPQLAGRYFQRVLDKVPIAVDYCSMARSLHRHARAQAARTRLQEAARCCPPRGRRHERGGGSGGGGGGGVPLSSSASQRLMRDLQELMRHSKEDGISAFPADSNDLSCWRAILPGAPGSAWEGGQLRLRLRFERFPMQPPAVRFLPPIPFHPNVDPAGGGVCVDLLQDAQQWSPAISVRSLLLSLQSLLSSPTAADVAAPANLAAQSLLLNDPAAYRARAAEDAGIARVNVLAPSPPPEVAGRGGAEVAVLGAPPARAVQSDLCHRKK